MCTAATPKTRVFYMERTLDYEFSFGEEITIVPRNFVFNFKSEKCESHYAIIGMAHIANGFPLFYDAANEKGLLFACREPAAVATHTPGARIFPLKTVSNP